MYRGESSRQGDKIRSALLLRTVARFSRKRARLQEDAVQIRQHSPIDTPQHLGAGATPAEASTSTNTIDTGTSEEQRTEGKIQIAILLLDLQKQYLKAKPMERAAIQRTTEDVLKNALAMGELSSDEVGALRVLFLTHPAVADKGLLRESSMIPVAMLEQ